jgi:putative flippase GtrA
VIRAFASRQFASFIVTGGIAAAVNFGSRILFDRWMGFSAAVVLAYATGMVTAFVLARLFVFAKTTQPLHRAGGWFVLVNLVAVAQTWLVSVGLANHLLPWLGVERFVPEIAHAVGVAVPVFTSYLGHKRWSFR